MRGVALGVGRALAAGGGREGARGGGGVHQPYARLGFKFLTLQPGGL